MDTGIVVAFLFYLVTMAGIGLVAYTRTRDLADYLLGGRRLGRWVTALSAEASDMSGWLLLGLPGLAYSSGLQSLWLAGGLLAGTWLNWRFMARRLRVATQACGDALTLPDYLAQRFGDDSHALRLLAAVIILVFFTIYTTSGLVAGGKLFTTVFGIDYPLAVLAGGGVILLYTFLGGFFAVCWTDLVQGLLMVLALVVVPLVAILDQGGPAAMMHHLAAVDPALLDPLSGKGGAPLGLVGLLSLLGWGLGYFGQPHILARFMAIRDPAEIGSARRIAVGWVCLSLAGAVLVGLAAPGYLPPGTTGDAEKVFLQLVRLVFHPWIAGILLAAVLAAIMSTADSQLLVASSALADDFYKALLRPAASPRELMWVGRLAVLLVAALATWLALDRNSRVLDVVAYAWAGFGAAFGPTLLLALYWPGMTRAGAFTGMLVGGVTVVAWKSLHGGLFDLYEIIPGMLAATAAILLASLAERRLSRR